VTGQPILETPRLVLRPFAEEDLDAFVAYRSDPEVARYQSWAAPYPPEKARQLLAEVKEARPGHPGEWNQLAILRKAEPGLVGDLAFRALESDPRQGEIGFTLARAHQGRGYAREAAGRLLDYLFGDLGLHRVVAVCDVENLASARLLERLGMRREAHHVENVWFKGAWGSEYVYALLERERSAGA
jgi:aminoglycoside 6'-N-acetyltransferase